MVIAKNKEKMKEKELRLKDYIYLDRNDKTSPE